MFQNNSNYEKQVIMLMIPNGEKPEAKSEAKSGNSIILQ